MSFTSIGFAILFPITLLIYYVIPERIEKFFLIFCSVFFYLLFDYRFILVLMAVTLISFLFGRILTHKKVTILLVTGVVTSLLPLVLLKYLAVFDNLAAVTGISFYTLQAISYMVDCHKDTKHQKDSFWNYVLFMSFFPTVVSGPIKRFNSFNEQIETSHAFEYSKVRRGLYMMALGYVEKLMLADCGAKLVAAVFDSTESCAGSLIVISTVTFGLQLYFDFAGYSYIAIGAALVLGYAIPDNFMQPYFATSIKEFWRRWHISLSEFLKDYVYIPLGGNRHGNIRKYVNLLITFLVSGIWHGVGLNFVFWGALHGIYQVVSDIKNRIFHPNESNALLRVLKSALVFIMVDYAWLFFRVNSLSQGFEFTKNIFTNFDISVLLSGWIFDAGMNKIQLLFWIIVAILIFVFDVCMYQNIDLFEKLGSCKAYIRWTVYFVAIGIIIVGALSGVGKNAGAFIYGGF